MGEVVLARTSLTLHPPSPPTVHQLSRLSTLGANPKQWLIMSNNIRNCLFEQLAVAH